MPAVNKTPLSGRHAAIPTPPSTQGRSILGLGAPMIVDVTLDKNDKHYHQQTHKRGSSDTVSDDENENTENNDPSPTAKRKRPSEGALGVNLGPLKRSRLTTLNVYAGAGDISGIHSDSVSGVGSISDTTKTVEDGEKWSGDVEKAFKQALAIIPKQGLNKIKISGKACGRNELISDYILAKTGKFRSRKQVSSHIQVVKNMKNDPEIVKLIVDGPPKDEEVKKRFDAEFGRISMAKLFGTTSSSTTTTTTTNSTATATADSSISAPPVTPVRAPATAPARRTHGIHDRASDLQSIDVTLKKFTMNYINFNHPPDSHNYTSLPANFFQPPLRIRTNANLSYRFPQLFELVDSIKAVLAVSTPVKYAGPQRVSASIPPVPILHGMVKLTTPSVDKDLVSGQYNVNCTINLSNLPVSDENYCCLTSIYSFGRSIVTTLEKLDARFVRKVNGKKEVSLDIRIGTKYWFDFFNGIFKLIKSPAQSSENDESTILSRAIKGITMQQVIFNVSAAPDAAHSFKHCLSLDEIQKCDVRAILLWEFLRVDTPDEAETTVRRIHLPISDSKKGRSTAAAPMAAPAAAPMAAPKAAAPPPAPPATAIPTHVIAPTTMSPLYSSAIPLQSQETSNPSPPNLDLFPASSSGPVSVSVSDQFQEPSFGCEFDAGDVDTFQTPISGSLRSDGGDHHKQFDLLTPFNDTDPFLSSVDGSMPVPGPGDRLFEAKFDHSDDAADFGYMW